jgi:membrane protein
MIGPRQLGRAVRCSFRDVNANHIMALSAGLAYYFLLSLFPLLVVVAALVPYLPIPDLFDKILWAMGRLVPPDSMGVVRGVLKDVLQSHPKLLSIGILGTVWAAAGGFSGMIEALNVAYDVPETRPWWRNKLLALGLTFLIGTFLVVSLALMVVGPQFGEWLADKLHLEAMFAFAWQYFRWGFAAAFTVLGIELLYFLAPNVKQRFWATLPGATFAVAAWLVISWAFGIYIRQFANFNKTYGTLGAAVALLVWFYWTNLAILFGAEINSELRKAAGKRPLPLKEQPEVGAVEELPDAA